MNLAFIGMAAALGLSASGSAFAQDLRTGSSRSMGKCYASGKPAPFIAVAFAGAPLTDNLRIPSYELYQECSRWRSRRRTCTWRWTFLRTCDRTFRIIPGAVCSRAAIARHPARKGTANYFIVIGIKRQPSLHWYSAYCC